MRRNRILLISLLSGLATLMFVSFVPRSATTTNKTTSDSLLGDVIVGADSEQAFVWQEDSGSIRHLRTSMPVFKAFGLSSQNSLLYSPLRNRIPSGELFLESLESGQTLKITSDLILHASFSPDESKVAYTFAKDAGFGLALIDLGSNERHELVPDNVLPDYFQWQSSGSELYYFETSSELNSFGLTARAISVTSHESRLMTEDSIPSGFPKLSLKSSHLDRSSKEFAGTHSGIHYPFQIHSPDNKRAVCGGNLIGNTFLTLCNDVDQSVLTQGQLIKVLDSGIIVRSFDAERTAIDYVAWNGHKSRLGVSPQVSYNLPMSKTTPNAGAFLVTRSGSGYSNACTLVGSLHTGSLQFAFDMQKQGTVGQHVVASADGLVVYSEKNVNCNSCDNDGCGSTYCPGGANGGWGNTVIIQHADGTWSKYAHMQFNSVRVDVGANVCQGLYLGNQGHTGCSAGNYNGCGDHLHYQKQSGSSRDSASIAASFSDVSSNPLSCINYTTASAEVSSCSPTLSISAVTPASTQTLDWGQSVTYTISVVDNSGSPVSGSTVTVSDGVRSFSTFTSPTNSSGQTIYTTTVPSGKADGLYDVAFTATKSGYNSSSSVIRQVQVRRLSCSAPGATLNGAVTPNGCTSTPTATLTTRSVSATSVQVNQPFTVSATLSVSNATADHAGISISFPSLTNSGISGTPPNESYNSTQGTISTANSSSITGGSTLQYYGVGELLTCSPSSTCSAQHLLIEGDWVSVGAGNTRSLNLTVTPKATGTFRVRIRGWATAPGYQNASRDPSSGSTDQQSFPVHEITVTVQQTCNAPGGFSLSAPGNGQSIPSATSANLTWGSSVNASSYDVYFGTSSNPPLLGNQTALNRTVSVAPGQTYFWKVVAKVNCSSATATAGVWSFSVQQQQSGCGSTALGIGQTASGSLNTSDCIYPGTSNKYYDLYSFSGAAGQQISASMDSSAFDTYLYLTNSANQVLAEDNNSGPGTNSRIVGLSGFFTLPATGTYYLWASSAANNLTGAYSVSLSQCTFSLRASENTVGPGNGGGSVQMDTSSGCSWSAVSDSPSWLTTSSSGTGSGGVSYNFNANPSTNPRTGRITVGGQVYTVTQIGLGGAGNVRFSSATYSANETGGDVTITVTRTGGLLSESGSVQYTASNGTAISGSDYIAASGTLIFFPNETSKTFTVTILDDTVSEGNETINLSLNNQSSSFTIGSPATAALTIADNDGLSAPTANAATNISSNGLTANWATASEATGYRLDVSTNNSFSSFVNGYQNLDVGNSLSRTVPGLVASTLYYYRVRAYNAGGTSANSNTITVSTLGPMIFIEQGTANRAAALDSILWLKGPFRVLNFFSFIPDNHTRVILFTSDLGMSQPDSSQLTVRAGGVALNVESVGPVAAVAGMNASYVVVRLPDGLPSGDLPVVITLRGLASVNSPTLAIAPSGP